MSWLATMWLTISDFVRIRLAKVAREGSLPFDIHVPNKLNAETLAKSERGEDVHHVDNAQSLFRKLGI